MWKNIYQWHCATNKNHWKSYSPQHNIHLYFQDKFETEIWSIKCECVGMKFLECEAVNILFHQIWIWMCWYENCECEAVAKQNVNVEINEFECLGPSNLNVNLSVWIFWMCSCCHTKCERGDKWVWMYWSIKFECVCMKFFESEAVATQNVNVEINESVKLWMYWSIKFECAGMIFFFECVAVAIQNVNVEVNESVHVLVH